MMMSDFSFTMPVLFFRRLVFREGILVLIFFVFGLSACDGSGNGGGGKATLHWESPTVNTDGSALNDLAGFRVYHGRDRLLTKANAQRVDIDKASTSHVLESLPLGLHFFAVTAVDASGNESEFSEVISTDITGA